MVQSLKYPGSVFIFLLSFLLFAGFPAIAQTSIKPMVAYRIDLSNPPKPLTPLPKYQASFTLFIDPKTDTNFITIKPVKGDSINFYFEKPKQKVPCGFFFAPGRKLPSFAKFRLSEQGCPEPNPYIKLRDKNIEITFHLSEENNLQVANELLKIAPGK